jgi:pimeloyl-ACP methyl ester carboxylesterase
MEFNVKTRILILAMLAVGCVAAQDITGDWHGILDAMGQKLRIVLHVTASGDSLSATFDSPDQGAFGLPLRSVRFENNVVAVVGDQPPIKYDGELIDGIIKGVFRQSGYEFPLDLQREEIEKPVYIRPQEPKEPFPYLAEDITFPNQGAGIKLAGTLTLPKQKGPFPAVVLISGSGAQDRNEEIMGHKPFWVIADHLTRNGIAVLRFDDRGHGASEGDFGSATSEDFATDVRSAMDYLKSRKEIGAIGLMGHSEGGIIAPLVAADSPDVSFIVMLAGPGIRGDRLLLSQEEAIWRAEDTDEAEIQRQLYISGQIYDMIEAGTEPDSLKARIRDFIERSIADSLVTIPEGYTQEDVISQYTGAMASPWILWFLRHDPAPVLERVKCPVLAVIGSRDLQVPSAENLAAIAAALKKGGNKDYTVKEFPGLNHLFQECETGHPDEYGRIEQTISPVALEYITGWIKARAGLK